MSELHHRMPVKLDDEQVSYWLDCEFTDKAQLKAMLEPKDWDGFEISKAAI
jgi:putative SOS response-associated peptidase YedK